MEAEEQDDVQVIDENSISISFSQLQLQDYKQFTRPPVSPNPNEDIFFMNIDICSMTDTRISGNQSFLKIYGINRQGNSVLAVISHFIPYFYVHVPRNLVPDVGNLELLRNKLNQKYVQSVIRKHSQKYLQKNPPNKEAIINIIKVQRTNIRNYSPANLEFSYLKIETASAAVVPALRQLFDHQIWLQEIQLAGQTFQSNIPYSLRFMIQKDIVGMGWIKISGGKYNIRSDNKKQSLCQIEIQCHEEAVSGLKCDAEWSLIPPLRILSFDIECACEKGFPSSKSDPIIQIACVCKTTNNPEIDFQVVFVLGGAAPVSGVHLEGKQKEEDLLWAFEKLLISYDPDFIIGYNMINFDLKYILERADELRMRNYGHFGRNIRARSWIKKGRYQSKVMGMRETTEINIDGRIQLDMLIHMHKEHKLSSYRLNNVAFYFLKDQKEDVHHSEIFKLYKSSRQGRKRLAIYCLKDAQLPLRLMEKLCCLYNYAQMARVTGVSINYLLNRGQQIKVTSQLLRKAKQYQLIMPTKKASKNNGEDKFEGAFVLEPIVNYYQDPIATLDFASLYPSIMIAHNLCYTTLIRNDQLKFYDLDPNDVTTTTEGYLFVKQKVKKGLLPTILEELISTRKKAKAELAQAKDPMMKAVLQGRQLALKISANSVYGYTGALVGHMPCLQISSSVTGYGRKMIQNTRDKVLDLYEGSQVIYGDTDSVMVKFQLTNKYNEGVTDESKIRENRRKEAMQLGKDAANRITAQLFANYKPIKLEFQKVYCPYLLMSKKRYAGVYYSNYQYYDKIDKKGIESVRRDNCVLIREMIEVVLEKVLIKDDKQGVADYIRSVVSELVQNKIDISKLVISKAITKKMDEEVETQKGKETAKSGPKSKSTGKNTYKVKQAHVQLAEKMKKRDQNMEVGIGDRISYVMINGQRGSKNYENAEDPIKVLNEDLPIDYDYYIEKQLKPPLQRILEKTKIISNLDVLFSGEHTKNRYIPKINKYSLLGKFIKVERKCVNCRNHQQNAALCQHCKPQQIEIYLNKLLALEQMKGAYQKLWRECQNCQGSITMDILCSNLDCPIYYKRMKTSNQLKAIQEEIYRF